MQDKGASITLHINNPSRKSFPHSPHWQGNTFVNYLFMYSSGEFLQACTFVFGSPLVCSLDFALEQGRYKSCVLKINVMVSAENQQVDPISLESSS